MSIEIKINSNDDFKYVDFSALNYTYNSDDLLINRDESDNRFLIDDRLYVCEEMLRKLTRLVPRLIEDTSDRKTVKIYLDESSEFIEEDKDIRVRTCYIPQIISSYELPTTCFELQNTQYSSSSTWNGISEYGLLGRLLLNKLSSIDSCCCYSSLLDNDIIVEDNSFDPDFYSVLSTINSNISDDIIELSNKIVGVWEYDNEIYTSFKIIPELDKTIIKSAELLLNKIKYKVLPYFYKYSDNKFVTTKLNCKEIRYRNGEIESEHISEYRDSIYGLFYYNESLTIIEDSENEDSWIPYKIINQTSLIDSEYPKIYITTSFPNTNVKIFIPGYITCSIGSNIASTWSDSGYSYYYLIETQTDNNGNINNFELYEAAQSAISKMVDFGRVKITELPTYDQNISIYKDTSQYNYASINLNDIIILIES